MGQLRYADFSSRVHRQSAALRIPLSGSIEITRRCPLRCVHCYNNLPAGDGAHSRELSYEQHCRILDEIADAGCLWLLYTGGEIFQRKDFLDIYIYAKKKGLLLTLFTNGVLISDRIADYLAEWPPFVIEITIYGSTRETYERVTRVPGSFDLCLKGIKLLGMRGLPLRLKTVALTINRHEVRDMRRLAEGLGLEFRFDAMVNPRLDQSRAPVAVRLSPEEVVELERGDEKVAADWVKYAAQFSGPVHAADSRDELFHCGAGVSSFSVDPYGNLQVCGFCTGDTWDLRSGSFHEGWRHSMKQARTRKITRLTKCTTCEIKALCGMCPALGELENGDAEEPVDYLCRVGHLRTQMLGRSVPPHGDCLYCKGGMT